MATVAFIGLGRMGLGMAQCLLRAGHELSVYNRSGAKAAGLAAAGARACDSPRSACDGAEAVVAMTADDATSRAVWCGADGVLQSALAPGALAIECSTLSHSWVLELAGLTAARGLRYLDAPVTGLPADAAAGRLTLLVGADASHLESARPLLRAFSDRILHFGAAGTGTAYKLIVNLLGAVQIASLAEGLAFAERAGLDLHQVAEAIATGQAASPQVVRNARRIAAGAHHNEVAFTPALRLKDIEYALRYAQGLGAASPYGQLAAAQFRQLCEMGHGGDSESLIIEVARRLRPPDPAAGPGSGPAD